MKKAIAASALFFALLLAGCVAVLERPVYRSYPVYPEVYQVYQFTIQPERRPPDWCYGRHCGRHWRHRR